MSGVLLFAHPHKGSSELLRARSAEHGRRDKGRKARFTVLFFSLLVQKCDRLAGRRLRQSWGSQHRGFSALKRFISAFLALSGTSPLPPIFPWNTFAIRSSLPPQFFRTHVLPRLRVSVAVGSRLWAWAPHPCPTPSHWSTTHHCAHSRALRGRSWALSSTGQSYFQQKYEMAERLFLNLSRKLTSHHIGWS